MVPSSSSFPPAPHVLIPLPGPTYISTRSADVILSDIRPIKVDPDALRCLNAFLDEILGRVLSVARSLVTDRLKTGLLKVLPTALGQEALLEAEVELRAYWERTDSARAGSSNASPDVFHDQDFNLSWTVEVRPRPPICGYAL